MSDPAAWLVANVDLIRPGGTVLDVAAGSGRHARYLATLGFRVHAVDRDIDRLRAAGETPGVSIERLDLEVDGVSLGSRCYDAVLVFNYLHRPLMPALVDAIDEGGVLIYETFTRAQALRGHPRNPAFLLQTGELAELVAPLRILRAREGEYDGKCVASVVAMR